MESMEPVNVRNLFLAVNPSAAEAHVSETSSWKLDSLICLETSARTQVRDLNAHNNLVKAHPVTSGKHLQQWLFVRVFLPCQKTLSKGWGKRAFGGVFSLHPTLNQRKSCSFYLVCVRDLLSCSSTGWWYEVSLCWEMKGRKSKTMWQQNLTTEELKCKCSLFLLFHA